MEVTATVNIIDDDSSVRTALARLLRKAGYSVKAFASASEFLQEPSPTGPACLLLDMKIPDISGLDLLESLRPRNSLEVVFISGYEDVEATVKAMKLGALDFLTKPLDEVRLLAAVESALVRSAERYQRSQLRAMLAARYFTLTPREREVGKLVAKGLPNKQIAVELGAAEKTVKVHRGRVMSKLSLDSVAELVRFFDSVQSSPPASGD